MKSKKFQQKPLPRSKKTGRTKLWWGLLAVLLIVGITALLELTNTTHFFHKSVPATKVIVKAGKVTPVPTNDTSSGSNPEKAPTANPDRVVGGGTDTGGTASANTNPATWIVSQSGNITVKQPAANNKLKSGSILSGSAKVGTVNFRLIDSKKGVIAQGTLNVVDGNFSGTLNFTPQSSSGRLDVFNTDDQGVELNEIQISVSF